MISLALFFCTVLAYAHGFRSVCYFSNSGQYRASLGTFKPEDIDPTLCTHLVYSYAAIGNLDLKPSEWNDELKDVDQGLYSRVLKLRNANSNLKVLLAVGNFMEKPESFFPAVETSSSRTTFATNMVTYVRNKTFDGVKLEWANLAANSNPLYDKAKFLLLLKEIRSAFDDDSQKSGSNRLILAVTVPAKKREIDSGYLIPDIVQLSDFISIRALDMRTAEDKVVGLSSAFLSAPKAKGDDRYLSLYWVTKYYESMGIPKDKINIGISTFGRSFLLKDEHHYKIGDVAVDYGDAGKWSATIGVVGHYEMCQFIWEGGKVLNVPDQGGRYYVTGQEWISYEDTQSVIQKACFIKKEGYGGITFWTLDFDDFTGKGCREGKYPLITTALRVMSAPDFSPCSLLNSTDYVQALSVNKSGISKLIYPADSNEKMRVVCYYESWAYFRRGKGLFVPENINPKLCTHIVYAYAILKKNNVFPYIPNEISEPFREGLFERFVKAQKSNPALKVLLGVISGAGSTFLESVSPDKENIKAVAKTTMSFIKKMGFHGLAFTWEKPTINEKPIFMDIIQAFKSEIDADASSKDSSRLILSVVMPAGKRQIDVFGKDINVIEDAVDFLSIRTYDFHGTWEDHTGFNAPIFGADYEEGENQYLNLNWVTRYYFSLGISKQKMNIGIPTFAKSYTLQDVKYTGPYAPTKGAGIVGAYTGKPGLLAFYEVCDFIARGATTVWASGQRVPYAFLEDQWVSYEDADSVGQKACYAKQAQVGGVGVWSLDMDDFFGTVCGFGKYPLLSAIYNITQNVNPKCNKCGYDGFGHATDVGLSCPHRLNVNLGMRMPPCGKLQLAVVHPYLITDHQMKR